MQLRCDPVEIAARPRTAGMACSVCGCTDDNACPGGCRWVSIDPPVCSACISAEAMAEAEAQIALEDAGVFFGEELCPASPTPAVHVQLFVDETSGYCVRCKSGFTL